MLLALRCCQNIYFILVFIEVFKGVQSRRKYNPTMPKIVGGVETTIGQVPYLVNLRQSGEFSCGGSLITPLCVLTAAHCVSGVDPAVVTIHAGASRLSEPGEVRQVKQHFVSPFYSTSTLDMDVAILKLASALVGANIATIPLCSNRPESNQSVKVSGWGVTSEDNREPPDQVRTVNVRVVPATDCIRAYAGRAQLTSTMLCATVPGEKDSCSGDSGGPVVYNGQVCGIVSWGIGCARAQYPGVYTNVASRRVNVFIRQTLKRNCY